MSEQPFRQPLAAAGDVFSQFQATAKEVANEIDAGTFTLDDRIKAMHRLFELSVQGWAGLVQAAVSGPHFGVKGDSAPTASDPIPVTADPAYPRYLEVATSFVQVGDNTVQIPDQQIEFIPQVLKVGATQFQMAVKDPNLGGRSYCGAVRLTTVTPAGTPSNAETVTINDVEL
ncbi:MAG TPA: hypothetical protein VGG53_09745 [Mycobacterium sp.]|jgi:hypothetical protein|uniref:hypothetical protein n=1 Tax=Mycobacterium sp. TaxID=1785 RepID=UPI002F41DAFA